MFTQGLQGGFVRGFLGKMMRYTALAVVLVMPVSACHYSVDDLAGRFNDHFSGYDYRTGEAAELHILSQKFREDGYSLDIGRSNIYLEKEFKIPVMSGYRTRDAGIIMPPRDVAIEVAVVQPE